MALCTIEFDNPHFKKFTGESTDSSELSEALQYLKERVESDHRLCHLVVQKFFGNKKYFHLHNKVWRYDWAPEGVTAHGRKAWRMIVIVPNPDNPPYRLIAGAVYRKNDRDFLSLAELAAIYAGVMENQSNVATEALKAEGFHHVPNGDGCTRSICMGCLDWHFEHTEIELIKAAELDHKCPAANQA